MDVQKNQTEGDVMKKCPFCGNSILRHSRVCCYCKTDLVLGISAQEIEVIRWVATTLRWGINLFIFLPFTLLICYSIMIILTTAFEQVF